MDDSEQQPLLQQDQPYRVHGENPVSNTPVGSTLVSDAVTAPTNDENDEASEATYTWKDVSIIASPWLGVVLASMGNETAVVHGCH